MQPPEQLGTERTAPKVFTEPREVVRMVCVPRKEKFGRAFRKNAHTINRKIEEVDDAAVSGLQKTMESYEKPSIAKFEVSKQQVTFKTKKKPLMSWSQ